MTAQDDGPPSQSVRFRYKRSRHKHDFVELDIEIPPQPGSKRIWISVFMLLSVSAVWLHYAGYLEVPTKLIERVAELLPRYGP